MENWLKDEIEMNWYLQKVFHMSSNFIEMHFVLQTSTSFHSLDCNYLSINPDEDDFFTFSMIPFRNPYKTSEYANKQKVADVCG